MISLIDFRKLLGPGFDGWTDEEIQRIYELERQLADAIFDRYLQKRNQKTEAITQRSSL